MFTEHELYMGLQEYPELIEILSYVQSILPGLEYSRDEKDQKQKDKEIASANPIKT